MTQWRRSGKATIPTKISTFRKEPITPSDRIYWEMCVSSNKKLLPFPVVEQTQEWWAGLSSRLLSIWQRILGSNTKSPNQRNNGLYWWKIWESKESILLKETLRDPTRSENRDSSGIPGQLMDLSLKATINLLSWAGELMKNKFLITQSSTDKDAKLPFTWQSLAWMWLWNPGALP